MLQSFVWIVLNYSMNLLNIIQLDLQEGSMDIEEFQQQQQIVEAEESNNYYEEYRQKTLKIEFPISAELGRHIKQYLQSLHDESTTQILEQQISRIAKKLPKQKAVKKSVCAKVLKKNQQLVQCYDCRNDSTCVICMECFKNSNHEGHRFVVRDAVGGCCDCGDKEAWKEEGFCKFHNGQFLEFQVDAKHLQIAREQISKLMYIYFYLCIGKKKQKIQYSQRLIDFLVKLNTNNPYYNKIMSLIFTKKLKYKINSAVDKSTVLENIYKLIISGSILSKWLDLFIMMFSYYPFKSELVKVYFQQFSHIVNGSEQSFAIGGSISCQLLTSYQVVDKYCSSNSIGLGQGELGAPALTVDSIKMFGNYYYRMFNDFSYIFNLKGKTPQKYISMHLKNKKGLQNMFKFYDQIIAFGRKLSQDGMSRTFILITFTEVFYLQKVFIQTFSLLLKTISKNKPLLSQTINFLWLKCLQYCDDDEDEVFLFRTYERCFGMCLFMYSDFNYMAIEDNCKKLSTEMLKIPYEIFVSKCLSILQRVLKTYLMYPRISLESGLSQSLYSYLYFYKLKYHLVSSVDIVTTKIILLISKNGLLVSLGVNLNKEPESGMLQKYKLQLNTNLKFIKYLYTFYLSQTNVACQIFPDSGFYKAETQQFLQKLFIEEKGVISVERMKLILSKLFSKNVKYADEWIKENTNVNKQKKQFVVKQSSSKTGINYHDIWENSLKQQESQLSDPFKTKQIVVGPNLIVFERLWGVGAVQNLAEKSRVLYENNKQGIEVLLSNIISIFLIKRSQQLQTESKILGSQIILPNINRIPSQISQKLQLMGCLNAGQKQSGDQKKKQAERKKKLMQQKKQKMMQKYKVSQQKMLNNQNQMEQQQIVLNKYSSISSDKLSDQDEEEVCCICRNDDRQDFVYLVKVEIRNNQGLMKLGHGVSCLSFYSCCHAFDEKCIQKQFQNSNNGLIKCPLCKSIAQTIIPLGKAESNNHKAIQRIFEVLVNYFEKQQMRSVHEQIIKSYYNFMLVCLFQPANLKTKRCSMYRLILENLVNSLDTKQLNQLEQKIIQNYLKQSKNTAIANQTKMQGEKIAQIGQIEQANQKSKKYRIKKRKKQKKIVHSQLANGQLDFNDIGVKIQQSKIQLSLFEAMVKLIFIILRTKVKNSNIDFNELKRWKTFVQSCEKIKIFAGFVQAFIKIMFHEPLAIQEKTYLDSLKIFSEKQKISIFKQLPRRYVELSNRKSCSECGEISSQQSICLQCHWISCQQCPNSVIKTHTKHAHGGGVGVFMNMRTTFAYYLSENNDITEIGQLYQNDWGHSLNKADKWQQFELSTKKITEIQATLLYDKPLTANKK